MRKKLNGKIRVAHLIGSTGLYGAERWILALMRALDPGQVDATLVNLVDAHGKQSDVVTAARQRGLAAFDFQCGGRFNPLSPVRLAGWARKNQFHVLHSHGFKSDTVGLLTARIAGCRIVTTPHGWSLEANRKLKLYEKIDRNLFRFMDMVCPLSPDLADGIEKNVNVGKLRLIFNGVDIDEVQGIAPAERLHKKRYLIGYIGQLIERKDLSTLLNAVRLLLDELADVRLMLVGAGSEQDALHNETVTLDIAAQTDFMGFRADATALLKTFDVFVLPSRMEGIPRCVMEAMAVGVPVVVSDIPGNRNLVSDGETGYLFAPGNSHELAGKIRALMTYPVVAESLAFQARKKVEDECSNRRMAAEYTSIYNELLGGNAS